MSDNLKDELRERLKRRQYMKQLVVAGAAGALAGCLGDDDDGGNGGNEENGGDGDNGNGNGNGNGGNGEDGNNGGDGGNGDGTELVVGLNFPPQNLDPSYFHGPSSQRVATLMTEEVLAIGADNELKPRLVEEVPEAKNNARTYDYTIRDNAVFRNGDPVTAEDFKWTIEWQEDPDNLSPIQGRLPPMESLEVMDERTLRINLAEPNGLHPWIFANFFRSVVPKGSRTEVEETQGDSSGAVTNLSRDPSGIETGPFLFEEWESGSHVLLSANPNYWDDGLPNVGNVRVVFVEEASTRLAQLESGRIDIVVRVPPANADRIEQAPNVDKIEVPGNIFQVAYTNLQDEVDGEPNPLANRHNRRAVMFAIDNEEIATRVFQGRATPKKGFSFPNSPWASPNVLDMTLHDPDKAREELEQAGNPDGFDVTMTTISRNLFADQSTVLQNQLSQVGIEAEIVSQEESAHFSRVYGNNDWHIASSYGGQQPIPLVTMQTIYAENSRNHHHWFHEDDELPEQWEPSGPPAPDDAEGDYSNGHEWFVDMLRQAQRAANPDERFALVHRIEEYLIDNAIGPQLVFRNNIQAKRSRVSDYRVGTFNETFKYVSKS